jgi:hypothetical protein
MTVGMDVPAITRKYLQFLTCRKFAILLDHVLKMGISRVFLVHAALDRFAHTSEFPGAQEDLSSYGLKGE